jgi:diguanylate cyclase (GGDEF)-like protein
MNLPARHGKFLKTLTGFAVANLVLRVLFTAIFWQFSYNGLFIYSLISICLWVCAIILCSFKRSRFALVIGMIDLILFPYYASMTMGLGGGFYLLMLAAIPLNFYNTTAKAQNRAAGGILVVFSIILLFGLMQLETFTVTHEGLDTKICYMINLIGASAILALIGYLFGLVDMVEEKEQLLTNQRMLMMANTDPLTNLINRRIMMNKIALEKGRVDRGEKAFSLVMIDVDNFKQINDEFGHDGGDFVLINLSHLINLCLRKSDLVARWGGDEFLVMLPETNQENGQMVAEKIKNRIMNSPFIYREVDIPVTVTLGVAQCDELTGVGMAIRKADQALYIGKHEGKDRVVLLE